MTIDERIEWTRRFAAVQTEEDYEALRREIQAMPDGDDRRDLGEQLHMSYAALRERF